MEARVEHLKSSHELLRAAVKRASREPGRVGEKARRLAAMAEGHFLREEKLVLPLLALLPQLASGAEPVSAPEAPLLAQALRQELPRMCQEHRQIAEALRELARAAYAEGKNEYSAFIEEMMVHIHTEETTLYPAAIVAGEYAGLLQR